ncbi:MAG: ATP-binding protein [Muribaculaceae bacterium]|nr:ATP-binding protein [Muribaculaceae bacterium]
MAKHIIGRIQEQSILKNCYDSEKAELIAVYGRRRIGKTFLIKNFFKDKFDFYITGIYQGTKKEQLTFFNRQLCEYSQTPYPQVENWFDAFDQLKHYISSIKKERVVIFIDELPWLDTPRSRFTKAFELFWNSWASDQSKLKLIVCGSATTWMMSHLLGNKGGLHNRVTRRIKLSPFTLAEVEEFLKHNGIDWNRHQIAEAYMILGGTPYYLQMLQKGYSLSQNIDYLFFSENAELRDEYSILFKSLFNESSIYRSTVELLSRKAKGMTRAEMISALKLSEGGAFSEVLENLSNCDFIRKYTAFGKKERDVLYQLTDLFTLFFLRFVKNNNGGDEHLWTNMLDAPERRTWSGYSFEQLCLHHIPQIRQGLGISGIQSDVCSWTTPATENHRGVQIDLLINRKDQIVNLCEMKYSTNEYEITKRYNDELQERKETFRKVTKTRKALHLTMVTTYGIKDNAYSGMIQSQITLDDLFK